MTVFHRKRLLSLLVVLFMVGGLLLPSSVFAAEVTDISGHWAEGVIELWVDSGLAGGYPDGTFRPNSPVTRAEFMVLANNAFGFEEEAEIDFVDVSAGVWFESHVQVAVAAGYISGYPDGTVRPNQEISRQEAAAIIAQIMDLEEDEEAAGDFTDAEYFPEWSRGYIGAAAGAGYMSGYPDGSFGATGSITRAEGVQAMENVLAEQAHPAHFIVNYMHGMIDAYQWPEDTEVTLEIVREGESLFTDVYDSGPEGGFEIFLHGEGFAEFRADDLIKMSDETGIIRVHRVRALSVTEVDVEADTVAGEAAAGSSVTVGVFAEEDFEEFPMLEVSADAEGNWSADFSGIHDITGEDVGMALQSDARNNGTVVYWHVSNPAFHVYPEDGTINGYDWLPLADVLITVGEDEIETETDSMGFFSVDAELEAGTVVSVDDGITWKSHTVTELSLVSLDRETGMVAGTAQADSLVKIEILQPAETYGPPTLIDSMEVTADSEGEWSADFDMVLEESYNVVIMQEDEDGDATVIVD